jgi:hypothetical protein
MKPKKKKFKRHFLEKKKNGVKSRKGYKRSNYTLNDELGNDELGNDELGNDELGKDDLDMLGDYFFKDDEGV